MYHYQSNVMGERADCCKMAASADVLDSAVRHIVSSIYIYGTQLSVWGLHFLLEVTREA